MKSLVVGAVKTLFWTFEAGLVDVVKSFGTGTNSFAYVDERIFANTISFFQNPKRVERTG